MLFSFNHFIEAFKILLQEGITTIGSDDSDEPQDISVIFFIFIFYISPHSPSHIQPLILDSWGH